MEMLGKLVSWMVAVIFLLVGLVTIFMTPLGGLCLALLGLLFLPPVRRMLFKKTNIHIKTGTRLFVSFLFFVGGAYFINVSMDKDMLEYQVARDKDNLARFSKDRDLILSELNALYNAADYGSVLSEGQAYKVSEDDELMALLVKAKEAMAKKRNEQLTEELLAQVKLVPTEETLKNRDLYQKLLTLNPSNSAFKNKLSFYQGILDESAALNNRQKIIERSFSSWDGSHTNLVTMVKKAMNDPDSFEHDETRYWDNGDYLVVQMSYRGKNGFGGVVRNSIRVKTSLNGQILEVVEQS